LGYGKIGHFIFLKDFGTLTKRSTMGTPGAAIDF
jgi:hypothetical protein